MICIALAASTSKGLGDDRSPGESLHPPQVATIRPDAVDAPLDAGLDLRLSLDASLDLDLLLAPDSNLIARRGTDASGGGPSPLASSVSLGMFSQDAAEEPSAGSSSSGGQSAEDVARNLASPNSDLARLTFKNQFRWYTGDLPNADDQWNYTLLFQPIFPFSLGETASGGSSLLFVRPAIPIQVEAPVFNVNDLDFGDASGLGDIGFDISYAVTEKNGFLWAVGMDGTLPTATDSALGGGQLRLGPEVLLAKMEKWGVWGVFPAHQWNVTGWRDDYYATTRIQPVLNVLAGDGWAIGSEPEIFYDWASDEWTVPLNLLISKTVKIGDSTFQFQLDINYYVDQPDGFGPEWMIGFNVTPIVKNFIEAMFQ